MDYIKHIKTTVALSLAFLLLSCGDDEGTPIPITVNFTNTELGIEESAEVGITFSRAAEADGILTLNVTSLNLQYGEAADYYTNPAATNGEISLPYVAGANGAVTTVYAGSSLNIQQDETITVILADDDNLLVGDNSRATVTFAENFITPGGTIEINGGGAEFPNQAFIDLSKLQQTTVDKYTWDLGFHAESGSYQVVLNNSAYVMARPLGTTDIDTVTSADTVGFGAVMYLSNYNDPQAATWIDHQDGDLSKTAFSTVSETDSENPVFIIKRDGEGRNWKKVRVLRRGDDYTLLVADIDATSHQTSTITKNSTHNFSFVDLDNGEATVEPSTDRWDIMYSTYANRANFGVELAVGFNDFVILNRSGVSAAMVNTADYAYDDFTAADLSSITMEGENISIIGSSWRSLVNFTLVLNEDRFYVLQDGDGNHYKMQFTRLSSTSGERGYPEIKIDLLQ